MHLKYSCGTSRSSLLIFYVSRFTTGLYYHTCNDSFLDTVDSGYKNTHGTRENCSRIQITENGIFSGVFSCQDVISGMHCTVHCVCPFGAKTACKVTYILLLEIAVPPNDMLVPDKSMSVNS